MIVSISQPAYLPWLGYFHRIACSDLHIVLDNVQLEKRGFTRRNKIRTSQSWMWLSVPITNARGYGDAINKTMIAQDCKWNKKHWESIKHNYARAPYFGLHSSFFEEAYSREWRLLSDLLKITTDYLLEKLHIKTAIIFASEIKCEGRKDELILNLCKAVGADVYFSGALGKNYIREELFDDAGIRIIYQDYIHPVYDQVYPGFEPYMSAIDLLFNHGDKSLDIIMSGNIDKKEILAEAKK